MRTALAIASFVLFFAGVSAEFVLWRRARRQLRAAAAVAMATALRNRIAGRPLPDRDGLMDLADAAGVTPSQRVAAAFCPDCHRPMERLVQHHCPGVDW